MANGVLVVDKPSGWTSHDVVGKLRGVFHERRVGHGGTLDPMATGVLPVFLGRATRAADFVTQGEKEYIAALRLGVVTNTQDTTGETVATHPVPGDAMARLRALLPQFTGELQQIPPMYSAIKKEGKKLYELARKGLEVEREPRRVTIHTLELLEGEEIPPELRGPEGADTVYFRVVCSKGTYVRTLCHDLGEALGCGGCMAALRRTRVGQFSLARAAALEELVAAPSPEAYLRPVEDCFPQPKRAVSGRALRLARNGNPFPLDAPDGTYRVFDGEGEFLLLGSCQAGECRIIKSFYEV